MAITIDRYHLSSCQYVVWMQSDCQTKGAIIAMFRPRNLMPPKCHCSDWSWSQIQKQEPTTLHWMADFFFVIFRHLTQQIRIHNSTFSHSQKKSAILTEAHLLSQVVHAIIYWFHFTGTAEYVFIFIHSFSMLTFGYLHRTRSFRFLFISTFCWSGHLHMHTTLRPPPHSTVY